MKPNWFMTKRGAQMDDNHIEMKCKKCGNDFNLIDAFHEGNLVPKCPECGSPELDTLSGVREESYL